MQLTASAVSRYAHDTSTSPTPRGSGRSAGARRPIAYLASVSIPSLTPIASEWLRLIMLVGSRRYGANAFFSNTTRSWSALAGFSIGRRLPANQIPSGSGGGIGYITFITRCRMMLPAYVRSRCSPTGGGCASVARRKYAESVSNKMRCCLLFDVYAPWTRAIGYFSV